jgi:hypothetical protein
MKTTTIVAIITYSFIFLFLYTSFSKLMAFDFYLSDLKRSPLLARYAMITAIVVPFVELLVTALLIPHSTRKQGLIGSLILMLLFTLYVGYVLVFTSSRPCTCGGIIRNMTWPNHLVFNIAFLLLAIISIHLHNKQHLADAAKG